MNFDIVTIFPNFFDALDLSLVGKAKESGLIQINIHNLRDYTTDVHHSVDDSPFGGGAGMVMKADVWGAAIDAISSGNKEKANTLQKRAKTVLAIPTPSGKQLKQNDLNNLAEYQQIIIACGRYEGIDARVAQYYEQQEDFDIFEFSLGDYVLNGGEVAAIALVEGVARLLPGMMGNPQSLIEESHGDAGLLEYPNYTRPFDFRGLTAPEILTSGNHGAIARWRKNQALERTEKNRPDMILNLSATNLDSQDRAKLAEMRWFCPKEAKHPMSVQYRQANLADAQKISEFAALTWPDACPQGIDPAAIAEFVKKNLNLEEFMHYLGNPNKYLLYLAQINETNPIENNEVGEIVAYLLIEIADSADAVVGIEAGAPKDFNYDGICREGPLVQLSKAYVRQDWRGSGIFANFAQWSLEQTAEYLKNFPMPFIWLGTATQNKRAQRAYRKIGFKYAGKREFFVGDTVNNDVTMSRPLNMAQ